MLMVTLTHRSTDCLGGRLRRDAFRRHPSRGAGTARATGTSHNEQARPAQGRQRGRKPRHAASTAKPQERAMGNVVILKRGEQVVPKSMSPAVATATPVGAQAENAESVVAAGQGGAQALSVTASPADQCGEPSSEKKAETATAAADGLCPAPAEKGEEASATKIETETMTSAGPCSVPASKTEPVVAAPPAVKKDEVVAGADRARKAEAVPTVYSGGSFVVSPDPCQLPIPVAFFKQHGGHTAACA